jgi:hypothetical protein
MLPTFNQSLKELLKAELGSEQEALDVEFELPSKSWVSGLTRPTVNFFLHDIEEETKLRNMTPRTKIDHDRNTSRTKLPPRHILLKFQVAVFSADARDQNNLLWQLLTVLMKHQYFPEKYLPEAARGAEVPVLTRVIQPEDRSKGGDLWSALDLPPRPWLWYFVTLPIDLNIASNSSLILTQRIGFFEGVNPKNWDPGWNTRLHGIGGTVRDEDGKPLPGVHVWQADVATPVAITDADGRYELQYTMDGKITLWIAQDGRAPQRVELEANRKNNDLTLDLAGSITTGKKVVPKLK